jgi:hypothetical protein
VPYRSGLWAGAIGLNLVILQNGTMHQMTGMHLWPRMISFSKLGNDTRIVESFEAEKVISYELQKGGWQAILNNFKKYTESKQLHTA